MQISAWCLVALFSIVAVSNAEKRIWGTAEERKKIMAEAMSEAKLSAELRKQAKLNSGRIFSKRPATASDYLNKGFKRPTKLAIEQGTARIMLEDMVHRAELKLEELRRLKASSNATAEEKADMLADELYHKPGTLLTEQELGEMFEESECEDKRQLETFCWNRITVNKFRSIDGTCNNYFKPLQGASNTAFARLTPSHYEDGISELRGFHQAQDESSSFDEPTPSARLVSRRVVTDRVVNEVPFSHLLAQFGQFLDHDLDLGPEFEEECEHCIFTEMCSPIRVERDDTTFGERRPNNGDCLPFRRSVPICDSQKPGSFEAREQINVLTSYIDASNVYGSNEMQGNAVRDLDNPDKGLLRVGPPNPESDGEDLPVDDALDEEEQVVACPGRDPRDCFLCGDVRCNEQISLTVMHTLWLREHNRIARELHSINPVWSGDRVFEEARKIVGALMQKIVYYDYLPKVLGPDIFDIVIGRYKGYNAWVDASVPNSFATAAYRYGHSIIRPNFLVLNSTFGRVNTSNVRNGILNLNIMFFNPTLYSEIGGVGNVARGWVAVNARRNDEFMNFFMTNRLFETKRPDGVNTIFGTGLDLAALNIQRSRDHGLALYNVWLYFCQTTFPRLEKATFANGLTAQRLSDLHGNSGLAELWVAGLAEQRIGSGLLGPTFACIFGHTFRNVRDGDRFYFENPGVLRADQLKSINNSAGFSKVICDNTNTTDIQEDAFVTSRSRIGCDDIAGINLTLWKEDICFLSISAPADQEIISDTRLDRFGPYTTFSNKDSKKHNCLPILCPVQNRQTYSLTLVVFAKDYYRSSITTDPFFPSFSGSNYVFYSPNIQKNNPFIHIDERSCDNGSPSLTFTFNQASSQEDMAKNNELPDFLMQLLKNETQQQVGLANVQQQSQPESIEASAKQLPVDAPINIMAKEQELQHELQEALKKLEAN